MGLVWIALLFASPSSSFFHFQGQCLLILGGKASPSGQPKARPAKAKPPKPWQKVNEPVVQGDIVVPPRELRRGEKKMLKFRCDNDNSS